MQSVSGNKYLTEELGRDGLALSPTRYTVYTLKLRLAISGI
jgi:hypothetical protein